MVRVKGWPGRARFSVTGLRASSVWQASAIIAVSGSGTISRSIPDPQGRRISISGEPAPSRSISGLPCAITRCASPTSAAPRPPPGSPPAPPPLPPPPRTRPHPPPAPPPTHRLPPPPPHPPPRAARRGGARVGGEWAGAGGGGGARPGWAAAAAAPGRPWGVGGAGQGGGGGGAVGRPRGMQAGHGRGGDRRRGRGDLRGREHGGGEVAALGLALQEIEAARRERGGTFWGDEEAPAPGQAICNELLSLNFGERQARWQWPVTHYLPRLASLARRSATSSP